MKTEGDYRVVREFNPSGNHEVEQVKEAVAELITDMHTVLMNSDQDKGVDARRWAALAMTHYEIAAMFAVKALTARERE